MLWPPTLQFISNNQIVNWWCSNQVLVILQFISARSLIFTFHVCVFTLHWTWRHSGCEGLTLGTWDSGFPGLWCCWSSLPPSSPTSLCSRWDKHKIKIISHMITLGKHPSSGVFVFIFLLWHYLVAFQPKRIWVWRSPKQTCTLKKKLISGFVISELLLVQLKPQCSLFPMFITQLLRTGTDPDIFFSIFSM